MTHDTLKNATLAGSGCMGVVAWFTDSFTSGPTIEFVSVARLYHAFETIGTLK